jgi:hypothetical protein
MVLWILAAGNCAVFMMTGTPRFFVLMKEGGSWMVEVLHTWSYVAGVAGLGNESIT